MKKTFLFITVLLAILTSCQKETKKHTCSISWKIGMEDIKNKDIIIQEIRSGEIISTDTILVENETLNTEIKFDSVSVRTVYVLESELVPFEIVIEEANLDINIDKKGYVKVSGSDLNNKIQKNYDSERKCIAAIRDIEKERDDKIEKGKLSEKEREEYMNKIQSTIHKELDRIIDFIKENINNPVGEYYFFKTYYMMPQEKKEIMMSFATDAIKKAYNN